MLDYTTSQEEAQPQQQGASHQAQSSQAYPHRVRNDSDFISWLYGVLLPISSKKMSAQHKVLLLETLEYERRGLVKDMEGYTRVNLKTLASYAGASDDTASKALKWLEEIGALSCKAKYETSEDGNIQKRIYIKSVPHVLKKLHEISPEKARNHGGKRFTCSNCGEDDTEVIKTWHIHCKKCGHTALLDTKIVDSQGEREEVDEHSAWDDVLAGEEGHKQPDSPIPASCGTIYNYSPPPIWPQQKQISRTRKLRVWKMMLSFNALHIWLKSLEIMTAISIWLAS